jgi:hypothetical protein
MPGIAPLLRKFGMFKTFLTLLVPLIVGFATFGRSETLISGAIYFDSENTLQEVVKLSELRDNAALGQLVASHHVSPKTTENQDIRIYLAGPNPESPAEFRFTNNPTTYWTLTKFIEGIRVTPNPTNSETAFTPVVIPSPTPNSTPTPTPTPTPIPTPSPKSVVANAEREGLPGEESSPPPLRKHRRVKEERYSSSHPPSNDDEVPNDRKVWHLVNGHWKWYEKRSNAPAATAIPNAVQSAAPPVLRAQPVTPSPPQ